MKDNSSSRRSSSNRGVALPMVMLAIAILTVLAVELHYTVSIDRRLSRNQSDGLRAYYLAKSAVRFSMWRLFFYLELSKMLDSKSSPIPANQVPQKFRDFIWSIPIPPLPFKGTEFQLSEVEKSALTKASEASTVAGQFLSVIEGEGSKISLNLLSGDEAWNSSPEIQTAQRDLIIQMIQDDYLNDEDFQKAYPDLDAAQTVDAIIDYIDSDSQSRTGGDEDNYYRNLDPPRESKNRPLFTLEELRMVQYWEGELYRRYSRYFSVFPGDFYINVNTVDKKILKAMAPNIDEEALDQFLADRTKQPLQSSEDFVNRFSVLPGVDRTFSTDTKFKFSVNEKNFLIRATGMSQEVIKKMNVAVRLESKPQAAPRPLTEEGAEDLSVLSPPPPTPTKPEGEAAQSPPLNHMRIVYWREEFE